MRHPITTLLNLLSILSVWNQSVSFQLLVTQKTNVFANCRKHKNILLRASGSSDGSYIDADPILLLPLMEAELDVLDEKDGEDDNSRSRRDELKEKIDNARTAAEFGVRRAQVDFYDAFSKQDIDAMRAVWSDEYPRCVHPGGPSIDGKDAIILSWSQIFQGEPFDIDPARAKIEICGKTAMCSCIENTPNGGKLETLNVYQREKGQWLMSLHMASPIFSSMM